MIASQLPGIGEHLVQKVKVKGDSHFIQLGAETEYSSDALQILAGTIEKGKRYLLTDDLIATGGSILSAVQLIRQSGGVVDTVLVMTELLDFKAREKLTKEKINLVSILQFTNPDLQTLLTLQNSYDGHENTPISFQLSRYASGVQALQKMMNGNQIDIHLASLSPIKNEATQKAFQGMFNPLHPHVINHPSQSLVSEQPFGEDETIKGANNRLQSIMADLPMNDEGVYIAIENGIRYVETEDEYIDFAYIIVYHKGMKYTHSQDCCIIPASVIDAMQKDEHGHFNEIWGEAAKRMNLCQDSKNPHQASFFGGRSRHEHLVKALCSALAHMKSALMAQVIEEQHFILNRSLQLIRTNKHQKKGVFFSSDPISNPAETVDLYTTGCKASNWNIDLEVLNRDSFQVFMTGDAFALINSNLAIRGKHVIIHLGLQHEHYAPAVLLQEALQLCRCAKEHGAQSITLAAPDSLHPVIHHNDFHVLLLKLFKSSGVNNVYFYGKDYQGKLDETQSPSISLTLSDHRDDAHQTLALQEWRAIAERPSSNWSDDSRVAHFYRQRKLDKVWKKFSQDTTNILQQLSGHEAMSDITVSKVKTPKHILLCCSSNQALAEKIAQKLKARGESVHLYKIEGRGVDATIPADIEICGQEVTIIQSTRPSPDHFKESQNYQTNGASEYFFEAALIAYNAQQRGAKKVHLITPYQFSARSDKAENNLNGKTGAYVQHNGMLLEACGVQKITTAECHDEHTLSGAYTRNNINSVAVPALKLLSLKIARQWILENKSSMTGQLRLVAPDEGAVKRTQHLAKELKATLGDYICTDRVKGEKQRNTHEDTSAEVKSFNTDKNDINPSDKYLIIDDETATGSTLCQAIVKLKHCGAKDISILVVHNNMPLDWLTRQLCLARFLFLGVTDIHFSDTQEMGTLANSFNDMIAYYSKISGKDEISVRATVTDWFNKEIADKFPDELGACIKDSAYERFESMFCRFNDCINLHSLADEFANHVGQFKLKERKPLPYRSQSFFDKNGIIETLGDHSLNLTH